MSPNSLTVGGARPSVAMLSCSAVRALPKSMGWRTCSTICACAAALQAASRAAVARWRSGRRRRAACSGIACLEVVAQPCAGVPAALGAGFVVAAVAVADDDRGDVLAVEEVVQAQQAGQGPVAVAAF